MMSDNDTNLTQGFCADGWNPAPIATPTGPAAIVVLVLLAIVCVVTIFGSTLVIVAVLKHSFLRQRLTNYFIVNLAISDFLVGVLVMPAAAVQDFSGIWPFGHYCLFWVSLDVMLSTASILNLCVISIERYVAVTKPFHYEQIVTPTSVYIMIACTWFVSAAVAFIPVLNELFQVEAEPSAWITSVDPVFPYCKPSFHPVYAVISSCISFYIPTTIMIIVYTRVFVIARKHSRQIAEMEGTQRQVQGAVIVKKVENKAIKTMGLIMGVFVCCWLPFFVVNCLYTWDPELFLCQRGFLDGFLFLIWLGWLNSTVNAFIYSFNPQFRRAYKMLLCRRTATETSTIVFTITRTTNSP